MKIPTGVSTLARSVNVDPRELIDALKTQIMPNAKDAELMAFCMVANKYGLDPFMKQVYAVRKNGAGAYEAWIAIDGWYAIVERHPQNDGVEFEEHRENGSVIAITCRMFRKDRTRPFVVTEYMDECRRDSGPWNSHPIRMLRHKAFIQCARSAYAIAESGDAESAPAEPPPASGVAPINALEDLRSQLATPQRVEPEAKPEPAPVAASQADAVIDAEIGEYDSLMAELLELNIEAGSTATTIESLTTNINAAAKRAKRDPVDLLRERVAKGRAALGKETTP
jgi:phage recombination protein Bet